MMGNNVAAPVIAGLVVGIVFLVVFSFTFKPELSRSDAELIEKTQTQSEVKHFLQKYPNAELTTARLESGFEVSYSVEKQVTNRDASQDGISEKRLIASVDPFGSDGMTMRIECYHAAEMVMSVDHATIDDIDNRCFGY